MPFVFQEEKINCTIINLLHAVKNNETHKLLNEYQYTYEMFKVSIQKWMRVISKSRMKSMTPVCQLYKQILGAELSRLADERKEEPFDFLIDRVMNSGFNLNPYQLITEHFRVEYKQKEKGLKTKIKEKTIEIEQCSHRIEPPVLSLQPVTEKTKSSFSDTKEVKSTPKKTVTTSRILPIFLQLREGISMPDRGKLEFKKMDWSIDLPLKREEKELDVEASLKKYLNFSLAELRRERFRLFRQNEFIKQTSVTHTTLPPRPNQQLE